MKLTNTILMCQPDNFQVSYEINPWMEVGSVNSERALEQWESLKDLYESLGRQVEVITQDSSLPDMVFAADSALVRGTTALMSNFKYSERQGETAIYQDWYLSHDFEVKHLDPKIIFEGGGDSLWVGNKLLIGTGFRNSHDTAEAVSQALELETVSLELTNPKYYHLDTCLFVVEDTTAFWYPPAFSESSQQTIEQLFSQLIEFDQVELDNFAANSVKLDDTVVLQQGNPHFKSQLTKLGLETRTVDVSEFAKAGGGIHCLSNIFYQ